MNFIRANKKLIDISPSYGRAYARKIEIITQEDKKSWYRKAAERPFRSYFYMGGITFGICLVSNLTTAVFEDKRRELLIEHPGVF